MEIADVQHLLEEHERFWEGERKDLVRYKAAYEMNFWDGEQRDPTQLKIQTNDGYGYIESFQASLFAKNPAVVVKSGIRGKGSADKAQAICNHFLLKSRQQIEAASRMALIYPCSFIKLVPNKSDDIYDKVIPVALPPWEVIVDMDASRWSLQRYMGHVYWMPVPDAKEKFGDLDFAPEDKKGFFEGEVQGQNYAEGTADFQEEAISDMFRYIKVVEMYDMLTGVMYWWSPSLPDKWLEKVEVPFRDFAGDPVTPIVPFYYNSLPDTPLVGYSSMKRIYDQLFEMNVIRSFQANAVRKASRQWLVKKGEIDAEAMGQITSGIDGLFVEVDTDEGLDGLIRPVPHTQLPLEVSRYMQDVIKDKDKGSVTAPFMRGEATRATATEIAALAAYSSSEVGRLARERDGVIEGLAKAYLSILALFVSEEDGASLVVLDGQSRVVGQDDVLGDFQVWASDTASTPMSEAVHQQRLLANVPVLQSLGVPPHLILREMVRTLNLPEDFLVAAEQAMQAQAAAQGGGLPGQSSQKKPSPTPEEIAANPSPGAFKTMLKADTPEA